MVEQLGGAMLEDPDALLVPLLHRVAPEIDLDELDRAEPRQDAVELDSMDFLRLMSEVYQETGIDLPEQGYPAVASIDGRRVRRSGAARGWCEMSQNGHPSAAGRRDDDRFVQSVLVRPVRPNDDVGLMELYDGLDVDERFRRFFSSFHPAPKFFTALATVSERGGARVVAVLCRRPDGGAIIGEAGYALLPDGDGELDITVAAGWNRRLGHHLLDELIQIAAANGVINLDTDVLTVDRAMLELLRDHGGVIVGHDGWRVVRVAVPTGTRAPTWPEAEARSRVLVCN
jgi:hypothetical protein